MKRKTLPILILLFALFGAANPASAQIKLGGKTLNTGKLLQAGGDMLKAVTLSDADIAALSREAVAYMDKQNPVSPDTSAYSQRLKRLTENVRIEGLNLNFKVYEVSDVNAFACGDGSVRVFSSLMDLMDDSQLMAVIGHEIGHVVHTDTKDAMKNAYLGSAARNAAGAAGGTVAKLTESQLAGVVEAFSTAQFSQKQESAADDYGFEFCVQNGLDPYSMASALDKLAELSQGAQSSGLQRMFSSHPDSQKRAARMKARADELTQKQ